MSTGKDEQRKPFDLTQLQIERIQDVLDSNVERPSDLAEHWGISKSSVNMCFVRIRAKMDIHTTHQMLVLAQRVGVVTLTYDPGRGDADIILVRRDNNAAKQGG